MSKYDYEKAIDETFKPQDDFFSFVNKKWIDANPIPEDQARWGSFVKLNQDNKFQVRDIIEGIQEGTEFEIIKNIWETALDEAKREEDDFKPIQPQLEKIDGISSKEELLDIMSEVYKFSSQGIFSFNSSTDKKDSNIVVPHVYTGGLGLPDRDFYFDEAKKPIVEKYREYMKNLLTMVGESEEKAQKGADAILELETTLAEKTYTRVQRRDDDLLYNKLTLSELSQLAPSFNFSKYISAFTDKEISYLIIENPDFMKLFEELFSSKIDLETWKTYFKVKTISTAAVTLSNRFEEEAFKFTQTLTGQKVMQPLWERTINLFTFSLSHLIGKAYVEKHFPPSSKEKMMELVNNLLKILEERIKNLDWMTEETKEYAIKKLKAFNPKIGYPDEWRDFSSLKLEKKVSFSENTKRVQEFMFNYNMSKLYLPPNKKEWHMPASMVNAYFNPTNNDIVFPAGILQYPFFDPDAPDSANYGGIGTVIGHEMTHSFDDRGSKYNFEGNLEDWWHDQDREKFEVKAKYFEEEYNGFEYFGEKVNGKLTLGENLADHGGLKISYYALQEHYKQHGRPGQSGKFTPEQEFFMAYATLWRGQYREEMAKTMIKIDPHSPGIWRINGGCANVEEFHEAFDVKEGDSLYRNNIPKVW